MAAITTTQEIEINEHYNLKLIFQDNEDTNDITLKLTNVHNPKISHVETFEYKKESSEDNRLKMYEDMQQFLNKHEV